MRKSKTPITTPDNGTATEKKSEPSLPALYTYVGFMIRRLRTQAGLSHADLAERTGIPLGSIFGIEQGTHRIDLERLYRIADVLLVKPATLLPPPGDTALSNIDELFREFLMERFKADDL